MGLIDDIKSLFDGPQDTAKKLLYGRLHSLDALPAPIKPGTAYVQWWLPELWLRYDREWLNHYHPLVYSVIKMKFGSKDISIPMTLGESDFAERNKFSSLGKTIKLNYKMTPMVPYNSGEIEIAAALIAMREQNGMRAIIDAVGELSKLFTVPQLSTIASFTGPISGTLDALFGQGDQRYELGLHQNFGIGGEDVQGGYFIAAATNEDDYEWKINDLSVKEGRLIYANDPAAPVEGIDYMLFRLVTATERTDYEDLENINKWVTEAEKAMMSDEPDNLEKANRFLRTAKYEAWKSEDLTEADRARMPGALQAGFDEFRARVDPGRVFLFQGISATENEKTGTLMDRVLDHLNDTTPDEALENAKKDSIESPNWL